jgi:chemotaxis protein MotB
MKKLGMLLLVAATLSSCVGKKKFLALQDDLSGVTNALEQTKKDLMDCEEEKEALERELAALNEALNAKDKEVGSLEEQLDFVKKNNTNLLDRLSDLSVVSKTGAESIQKSLEALNQQSAYIQDLTQNIQRKDSINLAFVSNLKRSLENVNDEDVNIEVKKGVVYVSLSDKMLFKSGSATIQPRAKEVLGKVAKIINDHNELEVLVEGHTDNVPIKNDCIADNWDLSVKRATSVVRVLQKDYEVDPARMTAGGRSEYLPKAGNDSKDGRSVNRRTEIILTPKLDEFFKLMQPAEGGE